MGVKENMEYSLLIENSNIHLFIIKMTTTESKPVETNTDAPKDTTQPEITEKHGHHEHHEGCDHDHDEDHKDDSDSDDGVTDPNKKSTRSEKKFKKAMIKLGLKPLTGVNRVTVKKGKDFMVSIDDPEILKSENNYVVFGKVNMDDMMRGAGGDSWKNFEKPTNVEEKKESETAPAQTAPQD